MWVCNRVRGFCTVRIFPVGCAEVLLGCYSGVAILVMLYRIPYLVSAMLDNFPLESVIMRIANDDNLTRILPCGCRLCDFGRRLRCGSIY